MKEAAVMIQKVLCIAAVISIIFASDAFTQKQKKSKKLTKPKPSVLIEKQVPFTPTFTGERGTVASYFFPTDSGVEWTMRTITKQFDDTGRVIASDTGYVMQRVIEPKAFSLQYLPVIHCRTFGWRTGMSDSIIGKAMYYVDDSIAMTVVNNSVTHIENRVFLVSPLKVGNAWHEKYDDSIYCVIVSLSDSVETPLGTFDSAMVTVTRAGYAEMTKWYVQGYGLIRSVYRAPGPSSRGLIVVLTEMISLSKRDRENFHNDRKEILIDK